MFLDDELYLCVKSWPIDKPDDLRVLINKLYDIIQEYYKSRLSPNMTYEEGTAMMKKAFKLWDMFIAKLEKENYFLADILKEHSFKDRFLSNPKIKEIYEKGL